MLAPGALNGVRVLELASIVAGPFCGTLLSEFGADGGTSSPGLPSKKPAGRSAKPMQATGITGQSSGRTT